MKVPYFTLIKNSIYETDSILMLNEMIEDIERVAHENFSDLLQADALTFVDKNEINFSNSIQQDIEKITSVDDYIFVINTLSTESVSNVWIIFHLQDILFSFVQRIQFIKPQMISKIASITVNICNIFPSEIMRFILDKLSHTDRAKIAIVNKSFNECNQLITKNDINSPDIVFDPVHYQTSFKRGNLFLEPAIVVRMMNYVRNITLKGYWKNINYSFFKYILKNCSKNFNEVKKLQLSNCYCNEEFLEYIQLVLQHDKITFSKLEELKIKSERTISTFNHVNNFCIDFFFNFSHSYDLKSLNLQGFKTIDLTNIMLRFTKIIAIKIKFQNELLLKMNTINQIKHMKVCSKLTQGTSVVLPDLTKLSSLNIQGISLMSLISEKNINIFQLQFFRYSYIYKDLATIIDKILNKQFFPKLQHFHLQIPKRVVYQFMLEINEQNNIIKKNITFNTKLDFLIEIIEDRFPYNCIYNADNETYSDEKTEILTFFKLFTNVKIIVMKNKILKNEQWNNFFHTNGLKTYESCD